MHWLDGSDTIRVITDKFNTINWLTNGTRMNDHISDDKHSWNEREIVCYYEYDIEEERTYLVFGRGVLGDIYEYTETTLGVPTTYLCHYRITITPLTDDTKAVFGFDEPKTSWTDVKIPTWTRHQCFVKSSIALNDKNNILGHTRNDPYTPIKYYRLYCSVKKFWIELYETRYHQAPVVFPDDKRDDLIIEAIVCFIAQGMI